MAHPALSQILDLLLGTARHMLTEEGEFLPFAGVFDRHGRLSLLDAEPPEEEPEMDVFAQAIEQGLVRAARAGDIEASGLCVNVHISLPPEKRSNSGERSSDAICVQLEHREGECYHVYLPYARDASRALVWGEFFANGAEPRVFTED